jgi:hypothetical protein
MLGKVGSWVLASSLAMTGIALAAGGADQAALPSGAPAGVFAQKWHGEPLGVWLVGGGLVISGIVLVATGNGHGSWGQSSSSTPTTTTTGTTTTTTTTPTTTTTTGTTATTTTTH